LKETELSPRELAVTFIDTESYFVSEASTYRILKAHDLITSPAFIVIKAASEFKDKTTGINQLPLSSPQAATAGQRADRLHLHQGPWVGLVSISGTVLDDYSRYIVSTARQCTAQQCPERDGSSAPTCGLKT